MKADLRCSGCLKAFETLAQYELHEPICDGPVLSFESASHSVHLPDGQGLRCWVCERFRRVVWFAPHFCCATCKAVLASVGDLN